MNEIFLRLENFYIDKINNYFKEIKPKEKISLDKVRKIINDIPQDMLTEKICFLLIELTDGYILEFIPLKAKTLDMCLQAINKNVYNIKHYPKNLITFDLCVDLIKRKKNIFSNEIDIIMQHIPTEFKTDKLWDILAEEGYLEFIPEDKRTIDLCLISIKKSVLSAPFIPNKILYDDLTEEINDVSKMICLEIIKYSLSYIPLKIRKSEFGKILCLESVKIKSYNLDHVPLEILTEEIIIEAIYTHYRKQDAGEVLTYIKNISPNGEWFTEEVCLALIDTYYGLIHIPEEKRTFKICLFAVKKRGKDIELIPDEFKKDKEKMMVLYTNMAENGQIQHIFEVLNNNSNKFYIPSNSELKILYKKYIIKGYSLENISIPNRDEELCLLAVQKCGLYLQWVPYDKRTKDICIAALQQNKKSFQYVPQNLQEEIISYYLEKL